MLTLSAALVRSGADILVVAPRMPGAARDEVVDGVRVRRFRYFPARWERLADGAILPNLRADRTVALQVVPFMVAFTYAALRGLRRFRPTVVHAHWVVPGGLVARALRPFTRTPYVVTAHGGDAYALRGRPARRLKRLVLVRAAATVPVSDDIGRLLAPVAPMREPVPMGVDVSRIRADVGERRPQRGRVLFIGRLVAKKGVDILLQAVAEVPDASLVVAGGGPLEFELRALVDRLGLAHRVELLGAVPRSAVMHELSRAAVVALPSQVGAGGDQDGVPVVLGEAIAAGVPVVASDIGGLAEYLVDGESGLLVPPGVPTELAAALTDALDNPEKAAALAANATDRVLPLLSIDRTARAYHDVLAEVGRT